MTPKRLILPLCAALALTLPAGAIAKNNNQGHGAAPNAAAGCPPGLAKKNPACVPPGQARKAQPNIYREQEHHRYRVGDRVNGDYIVIQNPARYGLDPYGTYYRVDDEINQIQRDTRTILNFIGLASRILN